MDSISSTAAARNLMVDGQVRPNKVYDARLLAAMRHVPRERFLPPGLAAMAYTDDDVRLPGGRFLMQPMVLARLVHSAGVRAGERALVIGAGAGYGAALLAACGAAVTALEDDAGLLALARQALPEWAPGVTLAEGPLTAGWAAGAPYDIVLIEGAFAAVPPALVTQLAPQGGRLLGVRSGSGRVSQAVIGEVVRRGGRADELALQPIFDCATPALPGFAAAPAFVF